MNKSEKRHIQNNGNINKRSIKSNKKIINTNNTCLKFNESENKQKEKKEFNFRFNSFTDSKDPLFNTIFLYAGISLFVVIITTLWWISFLHHETSILDQRMYDTIRKAQISFEQDPLVSQHEGFIKKDYEKSSIILGAFLKIFSAEQATLIVIIICLILCGIGFSLLNLKKPLYLILLGLTPCIITTFATLSDYSIALCLGILSAVLFQKNRHFEGLCITIICSIFNPWIGLSIILFIFVEKIQKKSKSSVFFYLLIGLLCIIGIISTINMQVTNLTFSFNNIFSDLGGIYGISVILVCLGGIRYIEQLLKKPLLLVLCIPSVISLFFDLRVSLLLICIILAYYASEIIEHLFTKTWENDIVKNISLLAIILTFTLSALTHGSVLIQNQTTIVSHPVLLWIKESTPEDAIIVSYPGHGYIIKYAANRTVIADEEMTQIPNARQRIKDLNTLFYTRNKETAYLLLNKYNAHYILVSKEMKENLVWNNPDEGLLFLLENDNAFRHIYSQNEADVYYYSNFDYTNQSSKKIVLPKGS